MSQGIGISVTPDRLVAAKGQMCFIDQVLKLIEKARSECAHSYLLTEAPKLVMSKVNGIYLACDPNDPTFPPVALSLWCSKCGHAGMVWAVHICPRCLSPMAGRKSDQPWSTYADFWPSHDSATLYVCSICTLTLVADDYQPYF